MFEQYSLIQKGDVVQLQHAGQALKFEVLKVQGEMVALGWTHDNVIQLKWVPKHELLARLYPSNLINIKA